MGERLGRDPRARVGDLEVEYPLGLLEGYLYGAVGWGELKGIREEVDDDLVDIAGDKVDDDGVVPLVEEIDMSALCVVSVALPQDDRSDGTHPNQLYPARQGQEGLPTPRRAAQYVSR